MNYSRSIEIAKQLTAIRGMDHVISPDGEIYIPKYWTGPVKFTVKKMKTRFAVIDENGKDLNKPVKKKAPKKEVKKDEAV